MQPLADARCTGGPDVVLAHRLEHRRAGHAGDQPERVRGQRQGRQHEVPRRRRAGRASCPSAALSTRYRPVIGRDRAPRTAGRNRRRPVSGSRWRLRKNRTWSSSPSKNAGSETPTMETSRTTGVGQAAVASVPTGCPAAIPTGMAMSIATKISSRVAGQPGQDARPGRAAWCRWRCPSRPVSISPHVREVLDRQRPVEAQLLGDPGDVLGPGLGADVDRRGVATARAAPART